MNESAAMTFDLSLLFHFLLRRRYSRIIWVIDFFFLVLFSSSSSFIAIWMEVNYGVLNANANTSASYLAARCVRYQQPNRMATSANFSVHFLSHFCLCISSRKSYELKYCGETPFCSASHCIWWWMPIRLWCANVLVHSCSTCYVQLCTNYSSISFGAFCLSLIQQLNA